MTKVGAYAILRVHTVVFGPDVEATAGMADTWLFVGAVITLAVGAIGVLGARRLGQLVSFSVLGSMGTLMLAVSVFSPAATMAALYYLIHSTFAAAALFLVADLVAERRRSDTLKAVPAIPQNGLFAALFFGAAIAMAGMPPLSGFLGKLLVMDAMRDPAIMVTAWTAILLGSLVTIVGFARAGSVVFWKSTAVPAEPDEAETPTRAGFMQVAPVAACIAGLGLLAVFAGPVSGFLDDTSAQLFDRGGYVTSVLGNGGEG